MRFVWLPSVPLFTLTPRLYLQNFLTVKRLKAITVADSIPTNCTQSK